MPTVDTAFAQPAPPVTVTSPDGLLTATVDAANGGVLLFADFEGTALQASGGADRVLFYRGDGTLVRSGDPAWAPGGTAVAYDHEAPVGGSVAYYAVPETLSGAQGAATATLGIPNPWTGDPSDVWIKSPTNPGASIRVQAAAFEETARPLRTTMSPISGAMLGVSSWDVTGGLSGTLTIYTDGKAEYDAMLALLDGSPLLIQSDPERAGIPLQWYAQPVGDALSLRRVETGTGWDMRSWSLQLQECRRPATLDAPLMIPGNSYDTPPYVSYDAATATGLSYNALLGVTAAAPAGAGYGSGPYGTTPYGG